MYSPLTAVNMTLTSAGMLVICCMVFVAIAAPNSPSYPVTEKEEILSSLAPMDSYGSYLFSCWLRK